MLTAIDLGRGDGRAECGLFLRERQPSCFSAEERRSDRILPSLASCEMHMRARIVNNLAPAPRGERVFQEIQVERRGFDVED